MEITANITGISYSIELEQQLKSIEFNDFDINKMPSSAILIYKESKYGISKWVSPKRTRSYPYERVYNTLKMAKKITVIPVIKDEGLAGDRDYIQWDTISMMSLLDVYVILAYYDKATAKGNKISNQKFNNEYIKTKIEEIHQYHSSALHWNVQEMNNSFNSTLQKAVDSYREIEIQTKNKLHNFSDIERFQFKICNQLSDFTNFSRLKAKQAQNREMNTTQPKEILLTVSKAKITISNYLGGLYYLTVDEMVIKDNNIFIIENKHSTRSKLPNKSDIKDGLLKMILFSNLKDVIIETTKYNCYPELLLTSSNITGSINSNSLSKDINSFFKLNTLSQSQNLLILSIFKEALKNNFVIKLSGLS